jgi:hypothetical protein
MDFLAKQVQARLDIQELLSLSRLVFIEKDNPGLKAIFQAVDIQHGTLEMRDCDLFGLQIKHAYIITSDRTIMADQREPLPA